MEAATLDDLMAMNEQLAALAAAGVPIDAGLAGQMTPDSLGRINAAFARGVSRGETLATAVEQYQENEHVPGTYRALVQTALRSGDFSHTFQRRSALAELSFKSQNTLRLALFYPLVVCCLAYAGFVAFCYYVVPTLESATLGLGATPGPSLQLLQSLRSTMELWVALPPLVFALVGIWLWRRARRAQSEGRLTGLAARLPGVARSNFNEQCAEFAATLTALLNDGAPYDEALELASSACGASHLKEGAHELAAGLRAGKPPADSTSAARKFPPFLRWAIWHADETVGRTTALEMAASIYHRAAQQGLERLRLTLPLLACVFIGGGATLLYGIALFAPVAEMLKSVAN